MSQPVEATPYPPIREDWELVLKQLRAEGFSPIECIKVTRAVLHVDLGEAKAIVHQSNAWTDRRSDFETLHESALNAVAEL